MSEAGTSAKRKIIEISEEEELEIIMSQEASIVEEDASLDDCAKSVEEDYIMSQCAQNVEEDIFINNPVINNAKSVTERLFYNCKISGNVTINFNFNKK